jgi:hypothetical protein
VCGAAIVARLINLAVEFPKWDFVESLCFYVSNEENLAVLRGKIQNVTLSARRELASDIVALKAELTNLGDMGSRRTVYLPDDISAVR